MGGNFGSPTVVLGDKVTGDFLGIGDVVKGIFVKIDAAAFGTEVVVIGGGSS